MEFSNNLIVWYLAHKRDLPWRNISDPYAIWLSEIILQQTKIEQGTSYYLKFLQEYPTVFDLANASEQQVLKLWQGLGYYSRARNLHFTAKYIVENHHGKFPETYHELLKFKGIGEYTASAISSFSFDEPQAVVDGNVYRVLARIFGVFTPINTSEGKKEFKQLALSLLNVQDPATHNQAIMEFGALQCKPQNPDCPNCVFNATCVAFQTNNIKQLPVKTSKTKVRKRYFNYLVYKSSDGKTLLEKRTGDGIWRNLFQFPLMETSDNQPIDEKMIQENMESAVAESITLYNEKPIIHKLSHQHLHISFWLIETGELQEKGIAVTTLKNFPVPVVLHNFITEYAF